MAPTTAVIPPVVAPPPAQVAEKEKSCSSFYDKFNGWVDWTARSLCNLDCIKALSVKTTGEEKEIDGTLTKIAKVFFGALGLLVLSPFAAVGCAFNWVKDSLCGKPKEDANKPTAPPAPAPKDGAQPPAPAPKDGDQQPAA